MWVVGGLVSQAFILDRRAISANYDETVEKTINGGLESPQPDSTAQVELRFS